VVYYWLGTIDAAVETVAAASKIRLLRLLEDPQWSGERIKPMPEELAELDYQRSHSERAKLRTYRLRMLLLGFTLLTLSCFAGLAMSFYEWDRGSPFDTATWDGHFNPISRATYGPLVFTIMIFPVTFPVLFIFALSVYFGLKKQRLWPLAVVGYLALGVLWVFWLNGLWQMD